MLLHHEVMQAAATSPATALVATLVVGWCATMLDTLRRFLARRRGN